MGRSVLAAMAGVLMALMAPHAHAQDLARETARVEDLRSIREIKRLQALWGHAALAGDWEGMASLGSEDVRMVLPNGDAVGRPALQQWLRDRMGKGQEGIRTGLLNLRLWISPVITLAPDGKSARGRWRQVALLGENAVSAEWRGTTDIIDYVKTAQGWRIAQIRPYLNFEGPYESGWRHDAASLERAPFHYSPEQAGTVLPDRQAGSPRSAADLQQEAALLLGQSLGQNLAAAYGYYLDRGMYDDIVDLFAPNASIDVAYQGTYRGAEGVRRFLARYGAAGLGRGELNDRLQLMPLVSMAQDGSRVIVRTVELGMSGQHGQHGFWSAAVNTFLLARGENGVWRIALMHHSPLMRADYKQGWARPLPAYMSIGEAQFPEGQSILSDISYPGRPFTLPSIGAELIVPAPGGARGPASVPDALARAEAFDAAENLTSAYGYYIDQFAWREMASLFTHDGWREMPFIGILAGRDKILEGASIRYGSASPRPEFQTLHMLTQPYVTVSGPRAQVRARLLQFNSSSTGPGSMIAGVYEKQLVKQGEVWRLSGMDLDYTWMADYPGGWVAADPAAAEAIRPTAELLARYRIDAPLRGIVGIPFPQVPSLGFHYNNPVSARPPERLIPWTDIKPEESR